jgi:hypothetical protein
MLIINKLKADKKEKTQSYLAVLIGFKGKISLVTWFEAYHLKVSPVCFC